MKKEDIFKKLDEIYKTEKARGFFNHLVRAYFPDNKVEKIFVKPKGSFKCVITKEKLTCVNKILSGVKEESVRNDLFDYMHNMFKPNAIEESKVKDLIGDNHLAIQGTKTTSYMSSKTYVVFYEWVINKFKSGDKHIGWLLKGIDKNTFIKVDKAADNKGKSDSSYASNSATYTLGDLNVLQQLKDKLDKGNK
jgi:hypothetical protein